MACPLRPLDAQQIPPVCVCCRCGDELYETEECYLIDEEVICPNCLPDVVREIRSVPDDRWRAALPAGGLSGRWDRNQGSIEEEFFV